MFINENCISYIFLYLAIYNISINVFFNIIVNYYFDIKLNNFLHKLNNINLFRILTIITFFSIAGIPPFVGFFIKLTLLYYISLTSYLFIFILSVLLLIGLYFYLQNIRYLMWLEDESIDITYTNIKNSKIITYYIIVSSTIFICFGLFLYDDLVLISKWVFI